MNPIIENILTRRSCRSFTDEPVTKEQIETLLEVARYAPSGRNQQSWKFTAILNKTMMAELASAIQSVLEREKYSFYNGAAVILPSNLHDSKWGVEDNACALENIFLAANSLGLGSLWVNQLQGICDHPQIRPLLQSYGIPDDHIVHGFALIGYPTNPPKQVEKKSNFVILD